MTQPPKSGNIVKGKYYKTNLLRNKEDIFNINKNIEISKYNNKVQLLRYYIFIGWGLISLNRYLGL